MRASQQDAELIRTPTNAVSRPVAYEDNHMEHEQTAAALARQRSPQKKSTALASNNTTTDQASLLLLQVIADLEAKQRSHKVAQPKAFDRDDIIHAVDLFFHSISESAQCTPAAKPLIAMLQMPVLQSAAKNGKFFRDARHPARRLIKAIYQEANKIPVNAVVEQDQRYVSMTKILEDVLQDYDGDERIFLNAYFQVCQLAELA